MTLVDGDHLIMPAISGTGFSLRIKKRGNSRWGTGEMNGHEASEIYSCCVSLGNTMMKGKRGNKQFSPRDPSDPQRTAHVGSGHGNGPLETRHRLPR